MIDRNAEHESMTRRVEQAQKAIDSSTGGRSRATGIAKALASALDEAYERMTMAWSVLNHPHFDVPKYHTYRAQKAAELSICYTIISNAYDELCQLNVIDKGEKTELTTQDMIRMAREEERADRTRRRRAGL